MKIKAIAIILAATAGIGFSGTAHALPSVQHTGIQKAYTPATFLQHHAKKKVAAKHKHATKSKHPAKSKHAEKKVKGPGKKHKPS